MAREWSLERISSLWFTRFTRENEWAYSIIFLYTKTIIMIFNTATRPRLIDYCDGRGRCRVCHWIHSMSLNSFVPFSIFYFLCIIMTNSNTVHQSNNMIMFEQQHWTMANMRYGQWIMDTQQFPKRFDLQTTLWWITKRTFYENQSINLLPLQCIYACTLLSTMFMDGYVFETRKAPNNNSL